MPVIRCVRGVHACACFTCLGVFQVIIPVGAINEFREILAGYTEEAVHELSNDGQTTEISNDSIRSDNKTIFCDLKANARGKFLKLTTQTQARGGPGQRPPQRDTIVIPAAGFDVLLQLLNDVCPADQCDEGDDVLPDSRSVASGSKVFHLDVRRNTRGVYMTVTEATPAGRQVITVPRSAWGRLAAAMASIDDEFKDMDEYSGSAGMGGGAAPVAVDPEARKLWVENVPWTATEADLNELFAQCGTCFCSLAPPRAVCKPGPIGPDWA